MAFSFDALRRKMPTKELEKLCDVAQAAIDAMETFATQADKFLNGGKMPDQTADDIDKLLTATDTTVLAAQKKLKPKDPAIDTLDDVSKVLQRAKIGHRQLVGTLLSQYQNLEQSRADMVAAAAKKVFDLHDACKKVVHQRLDDLQKALELLQKSASKEILMNGGSVDSSEKICVSSGKMLGRSLTNPVNVKEFREAQKALTDIEALIDDFEQVKKRVQ